MQKNPKGLTMITIVLLALVYLGTLALGFSIIGGERAKARDAQRVSDMARLQVGFALMYNRTASYAGAAKGCSAVKAPVRTCMLAQDMSDISKLKDPRGGDYLVTKIPDQTSYEISFTLERGTSTLAKGKHVLTQNGVK
jgi:hypothetical protein